MESPQKGQVNPLLALWGCSGVRWALGYMLVLACGVGLVYYWRVAYGFSMLSPAAATVTNSTGRQLRQAGTMMAMNMP